jgi:hypothetical protein
MSVYQNFDILFDIFFWELENIVAKLVLIAWPFRYHDISFKYPLLVYLVEIPSFSSDPVPYITSLGKQIQIFVVTVIPKKR